MISPTAEYALRAIVAIAFEDGGSATTPDIAKLTKVPSGYLPKVLQMLGRAGLVESRRGAGGGFKLAKSPDRMNVLEVVNAVDPIKRIHECPLELESHGANLCPLHKRLDEATAHIENSFASTTIAELLRQPGQSTPFCEASENQFGGLKLGLARPGPLPHAIPQRRHDALIEFSRDHSLGLVIAKHLIESAQKSEHDRASAVTEMIKAWRSNLSEHFREEERLLSPVIRADGLRERLVREHAVIRTYVDMAEMFANNDVDPAWASAAGLMLRRHIQWEERELFPAIEDSLSDGELQDLAKHTARPHRR